MHVICMKDMRKRLDPSNKPGTITSTTFGDMYSTRQFGNRYERKIGWIFF